MLVIAVVLAITTRWKVSDAQAVILRGGAGLPHCPVVSLDRSGHAVPRQNYRDTVRLIRGAIDPNFSKQVISVFTGHCCFKTRPLRPETGQYQMRGRH